MDTLAPEGEYTERVIHAAFSPVAGGDFGFEDVPTGRVYEERSYSAADEMLRRTLTEWTVNTVVNSTGHFVARDPRQAAPVSGSWFGPKDAYLGMDVDVRVRRL